MPAPGNKAFPRDNQTCIMKGWGCTTHGKVTDYKKIWFVAVILIDILKYIIQNLNIVSLQFSRKGKKKVKICSRCDIIIKFSNYIIIT